jgi:hypothetical protein
MAVSSRLCLQACWQGICLSNASHCYTNNPQLVWRRALSTQVQQAGDSVGNGSTPEVQEDESGRGGEGGNGMGPLLGREEGVQAQLTRFGLLWAARASLQGAVVLPHQRPRHRHHLSQTSLSPEAGHHICHPT